MEVQSDKEYHRKAIALLVCFFIAFMYVETVLKPHIQKGQPSTTPNAAQGGEQTQQTATQTDGQPLAPQTVATASPAAVASQPGIPAAAVQAGTTVQSGYPSDSQIAQAGSIVAKTKALQAKVSLLGGRITELTLNDYRETQEPDAPGLNLIIHTEKAPFPLGAYSGGLDDAWTQYRLSYGAQAAADGETVVDVSSGEPKEIVLEGELADGRTIRKTFNFQPEGYFIDVSAQLSAAALDGKALALEWTQFIASDESSLIDIDRAGFGYTWFDGQKARRQEMGKLEGKTLELGPVKWASISDKYFMAALIDKAAKMSGQASKNEQTYGLQLSGTSTDAAVSLFAGPKLYDGLKDAGHELQRNVDFGILGMISAPLLELLHFFYGIFGNYGLAIVTLTILVRLVLYPLNSASFKQMKKMQDLKPDMDKVREQFKDKQEQQMQLMALYKKHGVNPLGGCLPVVLQMPIFFGLYWALMLAVELRHAPFALWITDLSAPEKLLIAGFSVPVMVILFVASMMVQQWTTPSQMDPTQKKVMMFMPLALGFMFASFPSGLTLYWLTSNLISIGQQKGLYHAHDSGKASALKITLTVSAVVFVLAFVVSLF